MFLKQRYKNMIDAFKKLVTMKKQNQDTIVIDDLYFSYTTKRGIEKKYMGFYSIQDFFKSIYKSNKFERINGFIFVELKGERDNEK